MAWLLLNLAGGIASILITWILLSLILVGIGLLLQPVAKDERLDVDSLFLAFWSGLFFLIMLLQVWHFVLPVRWHALALAAVAGLAGLDRNRYRLAKALATRLPSRRFLPAVVVLAGVWLANRAMGPCQAHDTAMYHIPVLVWSKMYPLVPGLGNLNGRMAFNNSILLFGAITEVGFWTQRSYHLVNGLFVFVLLAQICVRCFQLPGSRSGLRTRCLFELALLPLVVILARSGMWISSYNTDVPASVAVLVALSILISQLVGVAGSTPARNQYELIVATLLFVLAISIKLSSAFVAGTGWILAVLHLLSERGASRVGAWMSAGIAATLSTTMAIVWIARGIVLSGYPAYPSTVGAWSVDWAVPAEQAQAETAWVTHFARSYPYSANDTPYSETEQMTGPWLGNWLASLPQDGNARDLVLWPLVAALILLPVSALSAPWKEQDHRCNGWLLAIPLTASLAFWFVTAPNPRFALPSTWGVAGLAFAQAFGHIQQGARAVVTPLVLVFAMSAFQMGESVAASVRSHTGNRPRMQAGLFIRPGPDLFFHPIRQAALERYTTTSGLDLYMPTELNQCSYAPQPCTPHPAANLQLRGPTLRSGFRTDGRWLAERWPNPQTDFLDAWRAAVTRQGQGTRQRQR